MLMCSTCKKEIKPSQACYLTGNQDEWFHAHCGTRGLKAKDVEISQLKHDIERHIAICGTQEAEAERVRNCQRGLLHWAKAAVKGDMVPPTPGDIIRALELPSQLLV